MFFDIFKGKFGFDFSDDMGMDSDGNLMKRVGDHMAMDVDSGELHMVSRWDDDDDDSFRSSWKDDDDSFRSSWDNDSEIGSAWDDDDDW